MFDFNDYLLVLAHVLNLIKLFNLNYLNVAGTIGDLSNWKSVAGK
jgi:hypothetical protein